MRLMAAQLTFRLHRLGGSLWIKSCFPMVFRYWRTADIPNIGWIWCGGVYEIAMISSS
jgi:hypothetical protein